MLLDLGETPHDLTLQVLRGHCLEDFGQEEVCVRIHLFVVAEILTQALVGDVLSVLCHNFDGFSFEFGIITLHELLEQIVPNEAVVGLPLLTLQLRVFLQPGHTCFCQTLREM